MSSSAPVVAIVGPTAVGKSRLALEVATRLGGEIVTADSRQVYRYMDIGTAKPVPAERAAVPHHMLDLVEPNDVYTAGRFRMEGTRVLDRLAAQAVPALVTGGTGFYVRTLLEGLAPPAVPPDAELREALRALVAAEGAEALHRRLAARDPVSAARIHPRDVPRVVRALEIVEGTGERVAPVHFDERPALYVGLTMDRAQLHQRADRRIVQQMESGLVEETRLLLAMGYDPTSPALAGFGYAQMVAYLRGDVTLDEAVRLYQAATRRYIHRQMTWFRGNPHIHWMEAGDRTLDAVLQLIRATYESGG